MGLAFELAKKAIPEDELTIHPRVGAVIAREGGILVNASRNENERGSHAEYLAFKKAGENGISVEGATLYTTLEPCTYRHAPEFIPCAQRIIDAGISGVVIGMLDPNREVMALDCLVMRELM